MEELALLPPSVAQTAGTLYQLAKAACEVAGCLAHIPLMVGLALQCAEAASHDEEVSSASLLAAPECTALGAANEDWRGCAKLVPPVVHLTGISLECYAQVRAAPRTLWQCAGQLSGYQLGAACPEKCHELAEQASGAACGEEELILTTYTYSTCTYYLYLLRILTTYTSRPAVPPAGRKSFTACSGSRQTARGRRSLVRLRIWASRPTPSATATA